jgi:hypothetical protein
MGLLPLGTFVSHSAVCAPMILLGSTKPQPDFGDRLIRKIAETVT